LTVDSENHCQRSEAQPERAVQQQRCPDQDRRLGQDRSDAEVVGGALGKRTRLVVDGPELRAVAIRLLEVISEDLLELALERLRIPLDPPREARVQHGARLLRNRFIHGVAHENVREPERVVGQQRGAARPDEVLADERHELSGEIASAVVAD